MPPMEDIYKAHTDALNRHSDSLDAFVKLGGKAPAQSTEEKPTTRRRTADKDAEKEKPAEAAKDKPAETTGIYDAVKSFLDYGKEDDRDDEDERDRRAAWVKKMLRHFDVERARDIPEKNLTKVKRWIKLFADGEKVDFEVD